MTSVTTAEFEVLPYHPRHIAEFVEGQRTLAELIGLPKEHLAQLAVRGFALLEANELGKAVEFFRGLVALDPFSAWAHTALGVALLRSDVGDEAEVHLRRALQINPRATDTRVTLAEVLLTRAGARADGVKELERIVIENVGSNDVAVVRARMLLDANR